MVKRNKGPGDFRSALVEEIVDDLLELSDEEVLAESTQSRSDVEDLRSRIASLVLQSEEAEPEERRATIRKDSKGKRSASIRTLLEKVLRRGPSAVPEPAYNARVQSDDGGMDDVLKRLEQEGVLEAEDDKDDD